ncbi:snRNA-activating protein complex subunit 3-like [Ornithodoros turicata]|uniref:snRNA-activating protein complex subunit 3 n=1 Tax=Ornithodoros turicata TaxID=34597 RepID=A0A2R5L9B0_9ACAR
MEKIHEADMRPWITEKINIRDFKQNWIEVTKQDDEQDEGPLQEAITRLMNIPESVVQSLEEDCGPRTLCCGEEIVDMTDIPDNVDLMTLRLQKQDLGKRAENEMYRTKISRGFRRNNCSTKVNFVTPNGKETFPDDERIELPELAVVVQVFKPLNMQTGVRKIRMGNCLAYKIESEIAILGCQTLTRLREKITCVSDVAVPGDFSEDPDMAQVPKATDLYKSGFFFIGDTFYNDMSDPLCRDYSQVICEWAQNPKRGVGPFKTARMEETTILDLELRLGYPYLYVHQGYCEHLIVFMDVRMMHAEDSKHILDYPMILKSFPFGKRVLCMMCRQATAKWVTYGNERVTDNPFFFCEVCFRSYNYTASGKKIGEFRAQPFLDWNAVL